MKALIGTFNQEKALVGAFSVIVTLPSPHKGSFEALVLAPEMNWFMMSDMQESVVVLARLQAGWPSLAVSMSRYRGWKHPQSVITESRTQNRLHC